MTASDQIKKNYKTEVIPRNLPTPLADSTDSDLPPVGPDDKTIKLSPVEMPSTRNVIKNVLPLELDEQYSVLKKIGDGGMGVVYLAQDNKLGRFVAIKRLNKSSMAHPSIKQRFFQEAKTVAGLTHPHIVHIYALDEDEKGPFIVMEYIPGPPERSPDSTPPSPFSLVEIVQQDGPMSVPDALDMMIKISKTIEYAHRSKVIHRDLKPSNVLLDESYEPKIVDFGLARKSNSDDMKLTVPGEKMLSMGYGAPEQESDAASSDERADIYGLGALMYFCITGQNPRYFRESDLPKEVQMPIAKALETNRDKRWPTTTDFIQALKRIQAPSEIEIPTVKTTWRCKWCDTVNPVGVQFCEDCGWDGITPCLECEAKMHQGIQYCGECGGDAREYEEAVRLLGRLKKKMNDKDFRYVAKHAERSANFRPVGPNGRIIVEDILKLREESERAIERIKQLKEFIPMEISSQNYERARQFINEYRKLSQSLEFSSELSQIPEMIARRDLQRAANALRKGDIRTTVRLSASIADGHTIFRGEAASMLSRVQRYRSLRLLRNTVFIILGITLLYVMSAAPAYRFSTVPGNVTFTAFYDAEMMLYSSTFMNKPLDAYAKLWGVANMYKERNLKIVKDSSPAKPRDAEMAGKIALMRSDYDMAMLKIEASYTKLVNEWPKEYVKALEDIQQQMQINGDYDGWNTVRDELYYFEVYHEINFEDSYAQEPQLLSRIKAQFRDSLKNYTSDKNRQIYERSDKYIQDLTSLQKQLTKDGKMDDAAIINSEIKRVQNNNQVKLANAAFALEEERKNSIKHNKPGKKDK